MPTALPSREITCVISDLGGVLFDKSAFQAMKKLSKRYLVNYVWDGHNPLELRRQFFTILREMQSSPNDIVICPTYEGDVLPQSLGDWMVNARPANQIYKEVRDFILNHEYLTSVEKCLLSDVAEITFSVDGLADVMVPLDGVDIIKEVHEKRSRYKDNSLKLCLLSNFNSEAFEELRKRNQAFFELFDYKVISGDVKMMKPAEDIYNEALRVMDVKAENCIFIDDSIENVQTANKLGMHGILRDSFKRVRKELSVMGLLDSGHYLRHQHDGEKFPTTWKSVQKDVELEGEEMKKNGQTDNLTFKQEEAKKLQARAHEAEIASKNSPSPSPSVGQVKAVQAMEDDARSVKSNKSNRSFRSRFSRKSASGV